MGHRNLKRANPRLVTPEASSEDARRRMLATRQTGTEIERRLGVELKKLGLRYKVNRPPIPETRSRADILFPYARVAVFVDGCFWHGCPAHGTSPKTNKAWWRAKLAANRNRDARTNCLLREAGWVVLRFWEHEIKKSPGKLARTIATYVVGRC